MSLQAKLADGADDRSWRAAQLINWPVIKRGWLAAVEGLYSEVETWVRPDVARRTSVTLFEYPVGYYQCQSLELALLGKRLRLQPVATLVVGAFGRVDIVAEQRARPAAMLILTGSREQPSWQIWLSRSPHHRLPFRAETLRVLVERGLDA